MPEYGRSYRNKWNNKKFKQLTDLGKLMFDYVVIGSRHSNSIGLFELHHYEICAALGWEPEKVMKYFNELIKLEIAKFDREFNLVYLPTYLQKENNPIVNGNQFKKALKDLDNQPIRTRLYYEFITSYEGLLKSYSKSYKVDLPPYLLADLDSDRCYTVPIPVPIPVPETKTPTLASSRVSIINRLNKEINTLIERRFGKHNTLSDKRIKHLLNVDNKKGGAYKGIAGFKAEDILYKAIVTLPASVDDVYAYLRIVAGNEEFIHELGKQAEAETIRGGDIIRLKDILNKTIGGLVD